MCTFGALASPSMTGRATASNPTVFGSVTDTNSCVVTEDPPLMDPQALPLTVALAANASPAPDDGAPITLSGTVATITMDHPFQGAVSQGAMSDGDVIPVGVEVSVVASNTVEGSRYLQTNSAATLHVVNGVAQPLVVRVALPDTAWQPIDAASPVEFRELRASVVYAVDIYDLTVLTTFRCVPTSDALLVAVAGNGGLPPATFSGTVINGGGQPDAGATLYLIARDGSTVVASDEAAPDGSFSMTVPAGRYGLRIWDGAPGVAYRVEAPAPYVDLMGGDVSTVVSMPTWATLNVSVTSINGPVAGAVVWEPSLIDAQVGPFAVRRIANMAACTTDGSGECALSIFIGAEPQLFFSVDGSEFPPVVEPIVLSDPATAALSVPSVPAPPTIRTVSAGDRSLTVSFDPPGYTGQSPISGYLVVCISPIDSGIGAGPSSPIVITGMTNGFGYQCTVEARNSFGLSAQSNTSSLVAPVSVPDAPSGVQATAGHESAQVSYSVNGNGLQILEVTVTCTSSDGGEPATSTTGSPSGSVEVDGLTAGMTYTCSVTARNALGSGPTSVSNSFVPFAVLPLPTITALSRLSGPGGGGTKIAIRGQNLRGAVDVRFGDVSAASFTVNSLGTRIVAVEPPHVAGIVDVSVTTAAGTSAATSVDQFTYLLPTVTQIYGTSGSHLGGRTVTIRGRYFNGASQVLFGSVPATVVLVSPGGRRIVAIAPAQGVGIVDILVTTPGGTSDAVAADRFTFT